MRRLFHVLLVVLASAAAMGCGSEAAQEAAERSDDPVIAAAGKAADEETSRLAVRIEAGPEVVSGEGMFDLIDGDPGVLALSVPTPQGTEELEMRLVKGDMFMRIPGLERERPGKRWIRADMDSAEQSATDVLALQNPVELVRLLESASDFEEDGTTTVRGEEADRWRGTIDLATIAEADDGATAAEMRDLGLDEIPAEAAIDNDGRLRRISFTFDLAAMAVGSGEETQADAPQGQQPPQSMPDELTFAVELYDFGVDLDVEAPPRDEVIEAPVPPLTGQSV